MNSVQSMPRNIRNILDIPRVSLAPPIGGKIFSIKTKTHIDAIKRCIAFSDNIKDKLLLGYTLKKATTVGGFHR